MTLEELQTLLAELLPVHGGLRQMALGDAPAVQVMPPEPPDKAATLRVNVRLVHWERRPRSKELLLRELREQQIYLGPATLLQCGERLEAFLRASCSALQTLFAEEAELDTLMPHELWRPEVLKLARPHTADDFLRAIMGPSRLGRYLAGSKKKAPKRST